MLAAIKQRAKIVNTCLLLGIAIAVVLNMGTAYADNTVRSKDIVNGQVKTVDLGNNAVTSAKIKDGEVGTLDLATGAVTSASVADGSLTIADLGFDSVGSNQIATDAVNATEIADNSIDGGEIVNDSLGQSDIAAGGVGASEVADGSLTGADIASNSITTADIAGTDASGAISLGAGAVANGRCNFYNISVPGAVADQTVIISARATLPTGQILYGVEVPSADHVIMAACNFSGGTWDALSSFPIRTVTFG
jgi:hypothetical protein